MALEPGRTVGHYRLVEKLGEGGMGEVYCAEDTRLKRRIALKVLPAGMADDPERRVRFEREAQAVAALNHPNIVTLHSVEEEGGTHFLTMELVEGRSLGASIPDGGLPLERLLDLAIPMADAVAAAHGHGITHRDLKPDNIMVGDDGRLKVLDFGLAKLRDEAGDAEHGETQLPTRSVTEEGKILGTVAYMSPEQAEGKAVDPRSDVFSMGIILYQMATGQRPFQGDTNLSILSSILRETPTSVTDLKQTLPRHLGRIVRRCLSKDPARRYQTALGLRNDLEVLKEELESGEASDPALEARTATPAAGRGGRLLAMVGVAALIVAAVLFVMNWSGMGRSVPGSSAGLHFSHLTFQAGWETLPSLSPDGTFVAYEGAGEGDQEDIFLLRVGGRKAINLTEDSAEDEYNAAFSPDGAFLAFNSDRDGGGIFVMGATGEAVRRLTDFGYNAAWSPDGTQLVVATEGVGDPLGRNTRSELWLVDVASGETRQIYDGDAVQPSWSPGGHRIAFWATPMEKASSGLRDVWTVRPDGSDPVPVTDDVHVDWNPVWSPDGRSLYFASDRGGSMNLWRVGIDEESGRTAGQPEALTAPAPWAGPFSVAREEGSLVFAAWSVRSNIMKIGIDPVTGEARGDPQPVTRGTIQVASFDVSPDGEWIVFRSEGGQEDLYLVRSDGSELRKLTDDPHKDRGPSWTPDGERIGFYSNRGGRYEIWTIRPDGSDLRQRSESTGSSLWFPRWSPDGSRLLGYNAEGTYLFELGDGPVRKEDGSVTPPFGESGATFWASDWSPDGRLLLGGIQDALGDPLDAAATYSLETQTYRELPQPLRNPQWLPDARRVVGIHDESLVILDTVSGTEVKIDVPDLGSWVRVAEDGKTLYFKTSASDADLWLARWEK